MRATLYCLALMGCGAVRLGDEASLDEVDDAPDGARDARSDGSSRDAGTSAPLAVVSVTWPGDCSDCAELRVDGVGGQPPYHVEWGDGSRSLKRQLCGDELALPQSVVVTDAVGTPSPPHTTKLSLGASGCSVEQEPPVVASALLCLQNPSFEGTPSFNSGVPTMFDALPWSVCTNPSVANTPVIANESVGQGIVSPIPQPTDGLTWLGLAEDEQVSQPLCRAMSAGSELSFQIDLRHLYVGANVVPDTEASFLEIWGGNASDCARGQLLWASPKLASDWKTFCVTVRAEQSFDNLILVSQSDKSQAATTYLVVDNIVPVESCL